MDPDTASITGPAAVVELDDQPLGVRRVGERRDGRRRVHDAAADRAVRRTGGRRSRSAGSAGPSLRWMRAHARAEVADDRVRGGAADHDPEDVDLEVDGRIGRIAEERVTGTGALDVLHLPVVVVDPDAEPVPGRDGGAGVERVREAADVVARVELVPRDDDPRRPDRRRVRADPVERVRVVDRCPGVGARHGEPASASAARAAATSPPGTPTVSTPP